MKHTAKYPGIFSYLLSDASRFVELRPTDTPMLRVTLGAEHPVMLTVDFSRCHCSSRKHHHSGLPPIPLGVVAVDSA